MTRASPATPLPIVVAITGASGAVYAARLLEALWDAGRSMHLVVSASGRAVVRQELGVDLREDAANWLDLVTAARGRLLLPERALDRPTDSSGGGSIAAHREDDYFTPIASGSYLTAGMVVCPCSGATLSGVARAASNNLIQRAAEVHLKERRKLILVPRETPLSTLQLENMWRASQAGAVILPAAPGWYHPVASLVDLVDFVVGRILDQLGVPQPSAQRWGVEQKDSRECE
ncbi:MAG: UbiX family flavin prenyltransferase [Planctomycetota bacterium]|nr:MAG: UbiX family flavin prenyltransferase [Planctomycetota bacterium]